MFFSFELMVQKYTKSNIHEPVAPFFLPSKDIFNPKSSTFAHESEIKGKQAQTKPSPNEFI